jgi:hypothetical protein
LLSLCRVQRHHRVARIVAVFIGRLLARRLSAEPAVARRRIGASSATQEEVGVPRSGKGPLALMPPSIGAHDEDLDRRPLVVVVWVVVLRIF